MYTNIDNNLYGEFDLETEYFGDLKEGFQTHLAMGDLDNDGKMEVIVGNYRGGISAFESDIPSNINTATHTPFRDLGLKVYPNPAHDQVILELPTSEIGDNKIELYNASGQQLLQQDWQNSRLELDLNDYPAGVYWVKVVAGNAMQTQRFVIQ